MIELNQMIDSSSVILYYQNILCNETRLMVNCINKAFYL